MMRRSTLLFLALLPFASTAAVLAEGADVPKAVVPQPVKDFEVVARGEKISHDFEIRNEGTATLNVTDVRAACGCTVVKVDAVIEPGQVGKLHAEVDTSSLAGPVAKAISVFTNDPVNARIELVIKAVVRPYLDILPGYARFNYVQGETIRPITQRVWAADGGDFQVLTVKAPYDHLKVTYREAKPEEREADKPGPQYLFDVILDAHSPVGHLEDYVEITTNHPKQKVVKVPISGFVRPRQHVTPDSIDLGDLDVASLPQTRSATFMSFITAGIEVTKIESDVNGLGARVEPVAGDEGHRFRLLLDITSGLQKGPFNGTVKLHITDSQNPVVLVPVKGVVL